MTNSIKMSLLIVFMLLLLNSCKENSTQPSLSTVSISSITTTSAASGGTISSGGTDPITSRGVLWSTNPNPTKAVNDGITSDGQGVGSFVSNLTGLTPNTTYYVRAYATNNIGTSYGTQVVFTTLDGIISLSTTVMSDITTTAAKSGGTITTDGGALVTARGLVWSKSQNPTTSNNEGITTDGTATGDFVSNLTNLTEGTTYYVRAYATNSVGTVYGNQITFRTRMPDGPGSNVTDVDGNVYGTIWINNTRWLKQNLKTTKYNDNTAIPYVTDYNQWNALTSPGYTWYNNDRANYGNTYGALYNWYTVNTGKLCPAGWHVPSDAEWFVMENYVDPTITDPDATDYRGTDAGKKLKATSSWYNNLNGTDNYGFGALGAGARVSDYDFIHLSYYGIFWATTEGSDNTTAYIRYLNVDYADNIYRIVSEKKSGFSVRCISEN